MLFVITTSSLRQLKTAFLVMLHITSIFPVPALISGISIRFFPVVFLCSVLPHMANRTTGTLELSVTFIPPQKFSD